MLIPSSITPIVKGREQKDPGGNALAGASQSDSNPNRRHTYTSAVHADATDEAKSSETHTSHLIDRNPISSATQAALLALLSEPFSESAGGSSFAEIVEEATIEQSAAEEQKNAVEDESLPEIG